MSPSLGALIIGLNTALIAAIAVLLVALLPKPWQVTPRKWMCWAVFFLVCFGLEGGLVGWLVNLGVIYDRMG